MILAWTPSTPRHRTWLVVFLLAIFPLAWIVAKLAQEGAWLALGLLPPVLGLLWYPPWTGGALISASVVFFLFTGLRTIDAPFRAGSLFDLVILAILLVVTGLYHYRRKQEDALHQETVSALQERLTMAREHYKTGLAVNITNQKKFQKYFLLNRVSRVFGAQLNIQKLADVVIREVREVVGPERGRYSLAFNLPDRSELIIRSTPENEEHPDPRILEDQYGLWVTQHRTTQLVTDTNSDFRFQALGSDSLVRGLMSAPLMAENRILGMLRAESPWAGMFTTDDLRLFTIFADLTAISLENARLYQRAQELAITDGLTGLYLRRFFNRRLEEEITRVREHGIPFTLMILDLDHFKRINDRLGHLAGDQVLAQLAEILRLEARIPDILCRFGGEEFALILPHTRIDGGMIMAERIRTRVQEQVFHAGDEGLNLTISIGLAECPKDGAGLNELIRAADAALYTAKRLGRNRVVLAEGNKP